MMTIGKLAKAGGVGVETVRYYQRRGMLAEPERGPNGGVRRYDEADLRRLRFIRAAQGAGFSLHEIAELLDLHASDDRVRARELAAQRIAIIDAQLAELGRARAALDQLARCCAAGQTGPCPILSAFDTASAP
jgi:MerR family mercuric resistance operon transcriptional regulator